MTSPNLDSQLTSHGIQVNYEYNTSFGNDMLMDTLKYWIPADGGRPPSCFAVIILGWLISKTTAVVEQDEILYGRVLGGTPIPFATIAENLHISWTCVQRNLSYLVKVGLVHRTRISGMKEYSYAVINCRKKVGQAATEPKPKLITRNGKTIDLSKVSTYSPEQIAANRLAAQPAIEVEPSFDIEDDDDMWREPAKTFNIEDEESLTIHSCEVCDRPLSRCNCGDNAGWTEANHVL